MQFFDLNIPYLETPKSKIQEKSSKKQTRLKQIVKSMELGYTGIAYNVTINGIMSDFHRSTISPFPLSSLLNLSPSLSSTVAFHRRILGVPLNAAFRQYTRLTIVVESSAQCSPLNSGNPVIKSYDIVAVRPLNQNCFDLACQSCQVDLISIDFSEKLPFRLKLPMVKAAIVRGVYFEIMYSSLLQDVQVRRQMISNAKLLVDWTQGKNLIVSSAAPSVLELRGPNDVANLLSLLGLSNECAKATISKNCRLLVANVLRKKQFYKEAIRVEAMPPGVQTDPKEPWIVDHIDWDPLSSGEGDLVLDDIAKAFAESGKVFQAIKGTDMSDCVDAQSHGLQVNDIGLRTDEELCGSSNTTGTISTSEDFGFLKQSGDLENGFSSLCNSVLYQQGQPAKHCQQAILPVTTMASTNVEDFRFCSVGSQFELKTLDAPESATSPVKLLDLEMQNHIRIHSNNVLLCDSSKVIISGDGCNTGARNRVLEDTIERLNPSGAQTDDLKVGSGALINTDSGVSEEMQICVEADLSHSPNVSMAENLPELKADSVADGNSVAHDVNVMDVDPLMERNKSDGLSVDVQQLPEEMDKKKEYNEDYSVVITYAKETAVDAMMIKVSLQQENDSSSHSDETMMGCGKDVQENGNVEYQSLGEEKLGSPKLKRWDAGQVLRFPFKRLLQVQFKRKGRNLKCKTRKSVRRGF